MNPKLYLEFYDPNSDLYVDDIDIDEFALELKEKGILKRNTWFRYDPQTLKKADFYYLQSLMTSILDKKYEQYTWVFQYRSD